jgi:hypothetical protein
MWNLKPVNLRSNPADWDSMCGLSSVQRWETAPHQIAPSLELRRPKPRILRERQAAEIGGVRGKRYWEPLGNSGLVLSRIIKSALSTKGTGLEGREDGREILTGW